MGELEDNDAFFDRFHKDHPNDVIGLSEYGADANPAYQSEHPEKGDWSEPYQAIYHEHLLKMWSERPYIWAMHCWNMFDFAADGREEGGKPGQNQKGLVTFDRKIKKDAFYLYKAYLSKTPFVHLCGRRYVDRPGKTTEIKVYTNQPRVSLYQDGKPVACQSGDKVFVFQVELAGEHCIRAEAGELSDEIHIRSVERENPSYRCGSTGVVNWFDKRKGMWLDGEVRYRRIPGNYAIVIGAGEIAASVIRNLLSSRRKGEINYRCESNNRYIILHTCQDARSVRETLSSSLPEEMMKKVIIYRGLRDSLEEIRRLDPYRATEIYILGESASENGGETFHDALNMRCVNIVAEELDRKRSASDKENYERRKVCKVMFEYQTTYSIFQFSDISEVISRNLVFIPFNRYESWARKVMVDCAADTDGGRHIKYTPLDGTGIGEDSDNFVHFIVVGMSKMGVSMGIQALHQAHYPNGRRHMTRISFIDTNADKEMDFFKGRYPVLFELARHRYFDANDPTAGQLCWTDPMERHDCKWGHLSADGRNFIDVEIEFIKGELESNGVRDWLRQAVAEDGARVTIAICLVHTHQAVAAALYMPVEVYKSLNLQEIWVYQREASDIISNLADSKRKNLSYNKLRPFGMLYGEYMADRTLYLKALLVNCAYDISQKNSIYKWPASMSDEKDEGYVMVKQSWKRLFVDKKWSNRLCVRRISFTDWKPTGQKL